MKLDSKVVYRLLYLLLLYDHGTSATDVLAPQGDQNTGVPQAHFNGPSQKHEQTYVATKYYACTEGGDVVDYDFSYEEETAALRELFHKILGEKQRENAIAAINGLIIRPRFYRITSTMHDLFPETSFNIVEAISVMVDMKLSLEPVVEEILEWKYLAVQPDLFIDLNPKEAEDQEMEMANTLIELIEGFKTFNPKKTSKMAATLLRDFFKHPRATPKMLEYILAEDVVGTAVTDLSVLEEGLFSDQILDSIVNPSQKGASAIQRQKEINAKFKPKANTVIPVTKVDRLIDLAQNGKVKSMKDYQKEFKEDLKMEDLRDAFIQAKGNDGAINGLVRLHLDSLITDTPLIVTAVEKQEKILCQNAHDRTHIVPLITILQSVDDSQKEKIIDSIFKSDQVKMRLKGILMANLVRTNYFGASFGVKYRFKGYLKEVYDSAKEIADFAGDWRLVMSLSMFQSSSSRPLVDLTRGKPQEKKLMLLKQFSTQLFVDQILESLAEVQPANLIAVNKMINRKVKLEELVSALTSAARQKERTFENIVGTIVIGAYKNLIELQGFKLHNTQETMTQQQFPDVVERKRKVFWMLFMRFSEDPALKGYFERLAEFVMDPREGILDEKTMSAFNFTLLTSQRLRENDMIMKLLRDGIQKSATLPITLRKHVSNYLIENEAYNQPKEEFVKIVESAIKCRVFEDKADIVGQEWTQNLDVIKKNVADERLHPLVEEAFRRLYKPAVKDLVVEEKIVEPEVKKPQEEIAPPIKVDEAPKTEEPKNREKTEEKIVEKKEEEIKMPKKEEKVKEPTKEEEVKVPEPETVPEFKPENVTKLLDIGKIRTIKEYQAELKVPLSLEHLLEVLKLANRNRSTLSKVMRLYQDTIISDVPLETESGETSKELICEGPQDCRHVRALMMLLNSVDDEMKEKILISLLENADVSAVEKGKLLASLVNTRFMKGSIRKQVILDKFTPEDFASAKELGLKVRKHGLLMTLSLMHYEVHQDLREAVKEMDTGTKHRFFSQLPKESFKDILPCLLDDGPISDFKKIETDYNHKITFMDLAKVMVNTKNETTFKNIVQSFVNGAELDYIQPNFQQDEQEPVDPVPYPCSESTERVRRLLRSLYLRLKRSLLVLGKVADYTLNMDSTFNNRTTILKDDQLDALVFTLLTTPSLTQMPMVFRNLLNIPEKLAAGFEKLNNVPKELKDTVTKVFFKPEAKVFKEDEDLVAAFIGAIKGQVIEDARDLLVNGGANHLTEIAQKSSDPKVQQLVNEARKLLQEQEQEQREKEEQEQREKEELEQREKEELEKKRLIEEEERRQQQAREEEEQRVKAQEPKLQVQVAEPTQQEPEAAVEVEPDGTTDPPTPKEEPTRRIGRAKSAPAWLEGEHRRKKLLEDEEKPQVPSMPIPVPVVDEPTSEAGPAVIPPTEEPPVVIPPTVMPVVIPPPEKLIVIPPTEPVTAPQKTFVIPDIPVERVPEDNVQNVPQPTLTSAGKTGAVHVPITAGAVLYTGPLIQQQQVPPVTQQTQIPPVIQPPQVQPPTVQKPAPVSRSPPKVIAGKIYTPTGSSSGSGSSSSSGSGGNRKTSLYTTVGGHIFKPAGSISRIDQLRHRDLERARRIAYITTFTVIIGFSSLGYMMWRLAAFDMPVY